MKGERSCGEFRGKGRGPRFRRCLRGDDNSPRAISADCLQSPVFSLPVHASRVSCFDLLYR